METATSNSATALAKTTGKEITFPAKQFFEQIDIRKKFADMLGKKAQGFITSVLQIVAGSEQLKKADTLSIYNAASTAATLDLPINNNLGFAWIVPYKGKAQFQIGWKGFTQLALRTGQYLRINVVEVYENQFKSFNALTEELDADFSIEGAGEVVGYCAYFKLINGFEKTSYWSTKKVIAHAKKYSQSYTSTNPSPWKDKDQFPEMCKKTVLKNTLSKWGILSIEMQRALITDQAVVNDVDTLDVDYVDNKEEFISPEEQKQLAESDRLKKLIENAESHDSLNELAGHFDGEERKDLADAWNKRHNELNSKK